jgi:hypothetical protein
MTGARTQASQQRAVPGQQISRAPRGSSPAVITLEGPTPNFWWTTRLPVTQPNVGRREHLVLVGSNRYFRGERVRRHQAPSDREHR